MISIGTALGMILRSKGKSYGDIFSLSLVIGLIAGVVTFVIGLISIPFLATFTSLGGLILGTFTSAVLGSLVTAIVVAILTAVSLFIGGLIYDIAIALMK